MLKRSPNRNVSGVTLVEVGAALAIFTLVMLTLMGALSVMARGVTEMRARMDRTRVICGVDRVIRRDFGAALIPRDKETVAFNGRNTQGEQAVMEFYSLNSFGPLGKRPAVGAVRVEYFVKPTEGAEGELTLFRRETPWPRDNTSDAPANDPERLAAGFTQCRLSFYNGKQWGEGWRQNSLPVAIRLELVLKDAGDDTQTLFFAPAVTPTGVVETTGK